METEIKQLKSENETLKHENAELRETNNKLKQSLDESVRCTVDIVLIANYNGSTSKRSRKQLLNVQERLTVTEQVTAATQRRELQQEGVYQNLPSDSVYEKLRFDPRQEHIYTALLPPMHTGCIPLFAVVQSTTVQL